MAQIEIEALQELFGKFRGFLSSCVEDSLSSVDGRDGQIFRGGCGELHVFNWC
jgi:hypothetical protein